MPPTSRTSETSRAYYLAHRAETIARSARWAASNRQRSNEIKTKYDESHPEVRAGINARKNFAHRDQVAQWREWLSILTPEEQCVAAHVMVALSEFDRDTLLVTKDWCFDRDFIAPYVGVEA